jgi:hypothetical protein
LIDPERASERAAPRNLSNVVIITTPAESYCCVVKPLASKYSADPHKYKISIGVLTLAIA